MKTLFVLFALFFNFQSIAMAFDCSDFVKSEDVEFADKYLALLGSEGIDQAIEMVSPEYRNQLASQKGEIQKEFGKVKSFQRITIGCNSHFMKGIRGESRSVDMSYQWSAPNTWYAGGIAWTEANGSKIIMGVHISPLTAPLDELNKFDLLHKSPLHWFFLGFAILSTLITLSTLVVCIRTKMAKRKWLWVLITISGLGQFTLNWTSGEIQSKLLSIQFFGAGFMRASDYAPVMLTVSIPLGAIIFLSRRRALQETKTQ